MAGRLLHASAAVLAAALVTSAALADEAPPAPSEGEEDQGTIVVTAQKREQRLIDVPLSVQAFTGKELETTGFRDLRDIIQLVPGAAEGRGNAAGIRSYQIRGVSSFLGDSTTGYYLDEAAYVIPNRNYAPVARAFDVERVEVLRGPQGTLFGLGSMGGTIRFITADPDLERVRFRGAVGASATGEGGQPNFFGDFAGSVPLVEGKLAVRGVASMESRGGFAQSPSFPGDWNNQSIEDLRVKLLARPVEDLTVKLGYYRNVTRDDWGQNLQTTDPARFPRSAVPGRNRQKFSVYTGYASYDFGPVLLESSTGYVDRRDDSQGPIIFIAGPPGPVPPTLTVFAISDSLVQEVRLVSQGDTRLQYVVGGIYQQAKNLEDIVVAGGPPVSARSIFDSESFAFFGEASYGFLDNKLRALVGLRYFQDDRSFFSQSRAPRLSPAFTNQLTFDTLNPRFNISYQPNADTNIYVNVAKGFRSGTFNTAAAVQTLPGEIDFGVQPDNLWSYEVGTKLNLFGNKLYAEFVGYFIDWSDIQLNYTVAGGVQVIRNAGDVRGYGFEWVLGWRPLRGLTLDTSGNINSTEFTRIINPRVFAAQPNIREGARLSGVPDLTFNLAATYQTPIAPLRGDLFMNLTYSYIGRVGDVGDPLGRFGEDHNQVRARIGVQWPSRVGVYVFGENLADDRAPILVSGSGNTRFYPRTIGAELRWDF